MVGLFEFTKTRWHIFHATKIYGMFVFMKNNILKYYLITIGVIFNTTAFAKECRFEAFKEAIISNEIQSIERISRDGCDANIATVEGGTPIMLAIILGRELIVNKLIESGARVDVQDELGRSPLFFAASTGHTSIARMILTRYTHSNFIDNPDKQFGFTPLHLAWNFDNAELAQLLLAHKASVDVQDLFGYGTVRQICQKDRNNVCEVVNSLRR